MQNFRGEIDYRNVEWNSSSLSLLWNTIGIYSHFSSPKEITSIDCNDKFIIVGTIFGSVHIFRNPCSEVK